MPRRSETVEKENQVLNDGGNSRLVAPGWSKPGSTTPQPMSKGDMAASEKILHASLSTLKSSINLSDAVLDTLGPADERESYHKEVLKRKKPGQRITGFAKTYVDEETKRLAGAIKKMRADSEKLVMQLEIVEKQCHSNIDAVEKAVEVLGASALDTKKTASRYLTKTRRVEKELSDVQSQLDDANNQLSQVNSTHEVLRQENERIVQENLDMAGELKAVRAELSMISKAKDELESKVCESVSKSNQLELDFQSQVTELQNELTSVNSKYDEVQSTSQTEIVRLQHERDAAQKQLEEVRIEHLGVQKELEHLKEQKRDADRAIESLESKQNSKDSHLEKVLETLQQAQSFSQERIEQLSKEKKCLEDQLAGQGDHRAKLDNELVRKEGEMKIVMMQLEQVNIQLTATQEQLSEATEKLKTVEAREAEQAKQLATSQASLIKLRNEHTRLSEQAHDAAAATTEELEALKASLAEHQNLRDSLESELAAMKATYSSETNENGSSKNSGEEGARLRQLCEVSKEAEMLKRRVHGLSEVEARMKELEAELQDTRRRLFKSDAEKRKLHNKVQDLRGNIRVVARARPLPDTKEADPDHLEFHPDGAGLALKLTGPDATSSKNRVARHAFNFNRVFPGATSQAEVFEEVSSFVQSALDGYNVCLFSYGQTGAGKTHTMTGTAEAQGIIPRSVDKILEQVYEMRTKGWEMEIRAMFIEIYNENIRDLLAKPLKKDEKPPKHEIRHSKDRFEVKDALTVPISESLHVHQLLDRAAANRSVAATKSNAESSRSHSVFTLYIDGNNQEFGASLAGSLSLCDLAGSERLDKSGATGDRLKETQAINKSLSALANVFDSLKKGSDHIPFRNSKLTYLLQPCFAGGGKSMMIVNLSSEEQHMGETLCSLRFAQNVNQTVIKQAPARIKDTKN